MERGFFLVPCLMGGEECGWGVLIVGGYYLFSSVGMNDLYDRDVVVRPVSVR